MKKYVVIYDDLEGRIYTRASDDIWIALKMFHSVAEIPKIRCIVLWDTDKRKKIKVFDRGETARAEAR